MSDEEAPGARAGPLPWKYYVNCILIFKTILNYIVCVFLDNNTVIY